MIAIQYWLERTMVIERLTSVMIYVLCLAFSYYFLRNAKTEKRVAFILNLYLAFLCVMAFFYIPTETTDLFRLRKMSDSWMKFNFGDFFNNIMIKSYVPVSYFMMYLCGKTGITGLLPMLSALVFYYNMFYILKDLNLRHRISPPSLSLGFLFLMSSDIFLEVISGVRCFAAISILARCFYDEMFNDKSVGKNVIWCILASLMHSLALVLYAIRICLLIYSKKNRFLNICTGAVVFGIAFIWGRNYLDASIVKMSDYITRGEYSFAWGRLLDLLSLTVIILSIIKITKIGFENKYISYEAINQMRLITTCLVIIALMFSFEYSIFHRTIVFVSMLLIPIISIKCNVKTSENYRAFIKLASILLLIVCCSRGNLSGYKLYLL